MVSTIIPAFNEEKTVGEVVSLMRSHPKIREVIVVDDGSSDSTAARAEAAGAKVIRLRENRGKAGAMDEGVKAASGGVIFFTDADVLGHTHETVSRIIEPVIGGRYEMYAGLRSRKIFLLNYFLRLFPIITGERAVTRSLWESLPDKHKKGFRIETLLNYSAKRTPKGMGFELISGPRHVIKERKYGLAKGLFRRLRMIGEVAYASFDLYVVDGTRRLAKKGKAS